MEAWGIDHADIYAGVWKDLPTEEDPDVTSAVVLGLTNRHTETQREVAALVADPNRLRIAACRFTLARLNDIERAVREAYGNATYGTYVDVMANHVEVILGPEHRALGDEIAARFEANAVSPSYGGPGWLAI
ncbi:hypothetical protein OG948_60005 (plasmid) [Embleya sp. NBC_00888]|uniref:hypothetical protein n=1 Tax=Embleya sp. NBC_00888 TaxID=2975960 RepID=UPI002F908A66|nr:hypothetical protein OG948_60005 [Embleya sp. NBC_00888]